MKTVTLYTDGACSGNPGPGGWGAILEFNGVEKELSGGESSTTSNRMELTAVIRGLQALKEPCTVELYSDSKYVIDALEKGWAWGWRKKGWIMEKLRLSNEIANIDGGLILRYGSVETNCSISALLAGMRRELEPKISAILFDQ